jgi:transposase
MQGQSIRSLLDVPGYKIIKIEKSATRIDIWLEPYKRNHGICSGCGKTHKKGFHSSKETTAEDVSLGNVRTYIHVDKRRYRCPHMGRICTEEISWLELGGRVTKRFSEQVSRLTAITTNQEAGWYLGLDDEKVYRIDKAHLQRQAEEKLIPIPHATNISIDEVSYRKHHRYLTNVVDVDEKKVIWNAKGRKKEILNEYYKGLGDDGCGCIETAALDGAQGFISSTEDYAINAIIVLDRFHATQKVNNAIDRVRKDELKRARKEENQELIDLINCKQRFILLKKKGRLSKKQTITLDKLCSLNEKIYQALILKDDILSVYDCETEDEAKEHLRGWFERALNSGIDAFVELARKILAKVSYILNWFKRRISSAISEGINNKIKRLKRMAYGYRDIDYFRLKIHQHCGLLNPRIAT